MFPFKKKSFRKGSLVILKISGGFKKKICNGCFFNLGGEEYMFVDERLWDSKQRIIQYCEIVSTKDWYKVS